MNWVKDIIIEIQILDTSNKEIRQFGLVISIIMAVIGGFIYLKTQNLTTVKWLCGIGLLFLVLGFFSPSILRPVYRIWMFIGHFIGGIISRIILVVLYYFILTPIGLLLRLFRKDVLDQVFDIKRESYWVKKDLSSITKEQYGKMY